MPSPLSIDQYPLAADHRIGVVRDTVLVSRWKRRVLENSQSVQQRRSYQRYGLHAFGLKPQA